ncbi:MAG: nicotinate-nucleotide adenylyltransferase [Acidimicrobiales bacterium]
MSLRSGERLGIFGGTFDPPHIGHLVTAVNVRHALHLDRVLLMVANEPWQKQGTRHISPARDRLALVEAAAEGLTGIEADGREIRRGGASYTADTLDEMLAEDISRDLTVILGSDAAAGLSTWERSEEVRMRATIAVVPRPGVAVDGAEDGLRRVEVAVPSLEVSSTDLRARLVDGRPVEVLLPPAVAACIARLRLYGERR